MALGERRRRSVIAKLVELAIALSVLLLPTSALALTRASVVENTSALAARNAKTRVRGFELGPAKIASGFELSSARNASGKSARERGEGVRVHHRNRVWSPDLAAFLSPDEFGYVTKEGTLWSWPNQNPIAWRDPSGRVGWFTGGGASGAFQYGVWMPGGGASSGFFFDVDPSTGDVSFGLYSTLSALAGVGVFGGGGPEAGVITDLSAFKGTAYGASGSCPIGGATVSGTPSAFPYVGSASVTAGAGGGLWAGAVVQETTLLGARWNPFRGTWFAGFL